MRLSSEIQLIAKVGLVSFISYIYIKSKDTDNHKFTRIGE